MRWRISVGVRSELSDSFVEFDSVMPELVRRMGGGRGDIYVYTERTEICSRIGFTIGIRGGELGLQMWLDDFVIECDKEFARSGLDGRWKSMTITTKGLSRLGDFSCLGVDRQNHPRNVILSEIWTEDCKVGEERGAGTGTRYHRWTGAARGMWYGGEWKGIWYMHGYEVRDWSRVLAGDWEGYLGETKGVYVLLELSRAGVIKLGKRIRENLEAGSSLAGI